MTTQPTHTPTPWRVGYDDGSGDDEIVTVKNGKDNLPSKSVAVVAWGCTCCKSDATDEDKANAAFIVRAVNAHEALVSVCKKIQSSLPHLYARAGVWPTENTFTKQLAEALALAEPRS